jgi:4-amino-4-deoxy-L-arabinose transferase-like glycosyltransferase
MRTSWFRPSTAIFALMVLLQVLWLALTWLTGASASGVKIVALIVYSLVVAVVVWRLPVGFALANATLRGFWQRNEKYILLAAGLLILIFGVVYAVNQRAWTDENSIFEGASFVTQKGLPGLTEAYRASSFLRNQHPPLMILLYGLALSLFGAHLFVLRCVTLVFMLLTLVMTVLLGQELYARKTGLGAALFLLAFPLFLRLGATAMTDVPVTFFFTLTMYLVFRLARAPAWRWAVAAGVVIVVGLLVKYTMLLIAPTLLALVFVAPPFRSLLRLVGIGVALAAIGLLVVLSFAGGREVLFNQMTTMFRYALTVIQTDIGKQFLLETLFTRLPAAVGVYNLPLILLGGWRLLRQRQPFDKALLVWIGVVSILLLVMLPDHRYFLPTFPALALLTTRGIESSPEPGDRFFALSLLYSLGALYLLVDWNRLQFVFLP